jgi:hypothetical protein
MFDGFGVNINQFEEPAQVNVKRPHKELAAREGS